MRALVILLAAIVVIGGAFFWGRSAGDPNGTQAPAFITTPVVRGAISLNVSTDGRVLANQDLDIRCKAGGEVVRVPFDIGNTVRKGELLLELEPSAEERAVRQAEVSLKAARARLVQARSKANLAERNSSSRQASAEATVRAARTKAAEARIRAVHLKNLLEKGLVSQAEADAAEASGEQAESEATAAEMKVRDAEAESAALELNRQEVLLAEAQMESAQIDLSGAHQHLADVRILSPIAGIVTRRSVEVGQIISSALAGFGGTPVMTISDLSQIFVLASVDESDIGRIREGQPATVTLDAFPGDRFQGRVVRIASRGANVSNVVTFEVKIAVVGENRHLLRPEMTANVQIRAEEKDGVLLVPVKAVLRRNDRFLVRVVKPNGKIEERTVETGISDGTSQEIKSGLIEGESVAVEREAGPDAAPRPAKKKKFWMLSS